MAPSALRHPIRHYRPGPDQFWLARAWISGVVALLHLGVMGLLLTYRIILPDAPDGPVLRLERAVFLPEAAQAALEQAASGRAPPMPLLPVTVPVVAPDVPMPLEARRRAMQPQKPRAVEAVIAEEALTPLIAANSLGGRGFDFMAPPTYDAAFLQNRLPVYPAASLGAKEEGSVVLRVLVTPQGRGHSAQIFKSSGHARLDEAAVQTVLRWRFIPAERGRRPVMSWTLVPIRFQADGRVMLYDYYP